MAKAAQRRSLSHDHGPLRTVSGISAKAAPTAASIGAPQTDAECFEALRDRLLAQEAVRPFADPQRVARAAQLLAEDLHVAARALLFAVSKIEGTTGETVSFPAPPPVPAFLKPPPLPVVEVFAEAVLLEEPSVPVTEPCAAPEPLPVPPVSVPAEPAPSLRGAKRYAIEVEVDLLGDSNFYLGFTENLSKGGLFVATYVLRPIGTLLDLSVRLAGRDEPLRLQGEVRWIRDPSASTDVWPGMGVCFHALSDEDARRILDFVQARAPLFFDD